MTPYCVFMHYRALVLNGTWSSNALQVRNNTKAHFCTIFDPHLSNALFIIIIITV